jgi:hypothetical protein
MDGGGSGMTDGLDDGGISDSGSGGAGVSDDGGGNSGSGVWGSGDSGGGSCSADLYAGVRRAVKAQARRNPDSVCGSSMTASDVEAGQGAAHGSHGKHSDGARDSSFVFNGDLAPEDTERLCAMSEGAAYILKAAYGAYGFSARQGRKMQRIARTIADIEGSDEILPEHITEAVSYRRPPDILGAGA